MATVSITNQTLTLTIDINGVETVIRKDNCKVVAIGDVVRITDYRGSIYEFLYSDCTAPDEASANDLRDAIETFLNTAGGGGGGGITTITSSDGSIDIDLTDPSAPDLSIPSGTWTPTISGLVNSISVTALGGVYSRVGNTVSAMAVFEATLGLVQNQGAFQFSLPIASNFTEDLNCIGTVVNGIALSDLVYFDVNADSDNNTVGVGLEGIAVNLTFPKLVIQIQYLIL
jgi:hypothetical protein